MPRKRGTALKSKIVDREKKFEAEHHRAEERCAIRGIEPYQDWAGCRRMRRRQAFRNESRNDGPCLRDRSGGRLRRIERGENFFQTQRRRIGRHSRGGQRRVQMTGQRRPDAA